MKKIRAWWFLSLVLVSFLAACGDPTPTVAPFAYGAIASAKPQVETTEASTPTIEATTAAATPTPAPPPATPTPINLAAYASQIDVVKHFADAINSGNVNAALDLFEQRSYISLRNKVDPRTGFLDEGSWSILIDVKPWLQELVDDQYHLTLSNFQINNLQVVCSSRISVNKYEIDSILEVSVSNGKIGALSIYNQGVN